MTVLQVVKNNTKVKPCTVFPCVRQIYSYKMVQKKKKNLIGDNCWREQLDAYQKYWNFWLLSYWFQLYVYKERLKVTAVYQMFTGLHKNIRWILVQLPVGRYIHLTESVKWAIIPFTWFWHFQQKKIWHQPSHGSPRSRSNTYRKRKMWELFQILFLWNNAIQATRYHCLLLSCC